MATHTITSAYNFVPLQSQVVQPDWQEQVSHDVPLKEGLCAELQVEIEAHTPLLVGGSRGAAGPREPVTFHQHPDGVAAIPGSSLRGMLRNVLEIVTFSRLQLIDDRAISLRDLYLDAYTDQFAMKPRAGWLRFDAVNGKWLIDECKVFSIEQSELDRISVLQADGNKPTMHKLMVSAWQSSSKEDKVLAVTKYQAVGSKLTLPYKLDPVAGRGALTPVLLGGSEKGYLVLTGQPGGMDLQAKVHKKKNKHLEFVFDAVPLRALEVDGLVVRQFQQVHAQSPDLKFMESNASPHKARGIPVFFMAELSKDKSKQERVTSMGLSRMYRLPGKHTLGALARKQQTQRLIGKSALDFVETLMGHIEVEGAEGAAKSRLSVGDLRWHGSPGKTAILADERFQRETVLAQPKPSFYPSYLMQPNPAREYKTILSDDAKLRGWKRYPVRPLSEVELNPVPKDDADSNIRLQPLAPGNRFRGQIRLHNVLPEELGAVVWALTWGQQSDLRHSLGMGKSFGFGQVSIRVTLPNATSLRANDPGQVTPDLDTCITAFIDYMERTVSDWSGSDAIQQLMDMADPNLPQANRTNLRPLRLQVPGENQFNEAKASKVSLRSYSSQGG